MKNLSARVIAFCLTLVSVPALAVTDYAGMVTSATTEVGLAVTAGIVLFGLIFGIRAGLRMLKSFAS